MDLPSSPSSPRRPLSSRSLGNGSASGGMVLRVEQSQVRELPDLMMGLLHQLHKVIYITQLPPDASSTSDAESISSGRARLVVDRYKRALFSPLSTSMNLKTELKQLSEGSNVAIPIDFSVLAENTFWSVDVRTIRSDGAAAPADLRTSASTTSPPKRAGSASMTTDSGSSSANIVDAIWEQTSITYGQLRQLIEHVLHKKGYYENDDHAV